MSSVPISFNVVGLQTSADCELLSAIVDDLKKEGGVCMLDTVIVLNSKIRKLLGDRRLLPFLRDHNQLFRVERFGETGAEMHKVHLLPQWMDVDISTMLMRKEGCTTGVDAAGGTSFLCDVCGESFQSRNKMFKHIKSVCRPTTATPQPESKRAVDTRSLPHHSSKEAEGLVQQMIADFPSFRRAKVPIRWLTSRAAIKWHLRMYVRSLPLHVLPMSTRHEFDTKEWWNVAANELIALIVARTEIFLVSEEPLDKTEIDNDAKCDSVNLAKDIFISLRRDAEIQIIAASEANRIQGVLADTVRSMGYGDHSAHRPERVRPWLMTRRQTRITDPSHCSTDAEELNILHTYADAIIVNKRSGLRMEDLVGILNRRRSFDDNKSSYVVQSVSRLDQGTSGAVVLPLTSASHSFLTGLFKSRTVDKYYLCVTVGTSCLPDIGEVDIKLKHTGGERRKTFAHPQGKPSRTLYQVARRFQVGKTSPIYFHLVVCKPITGRTHQIRAHMAHIGHPLVGDGKYAGNLFNKSCFRAQGYLLDRRRTMIHSHTIRYMSPAGVTISARADVPPDMHVLLSELAAAGKESIDSTCLHLDWRSQEDVALVVGKLIDDFQELRATQTLHNLPTPVPST